MIKKSFLFFAVTCLFAQFAFSEDADFMTHADKQLRSWLVLLDQRQYQTSYDVCDPIFHKAVTLESWMGALYALRNNFGDASNRELVDHQYLPQGLTTFPGEFVILTYKTQFSKMKNPYFEKVYAKRSGSDWYVVDYELRPPDLTPEDKAKLPRVYEDSSTSTTQGDYTLGPGGQAVPKPNAGGH